MSEFQILDAKTAEVRIPVAVALAGGAGSGKTWTALMIATELADGGPVGLLDTENGRGLEYRDYFDYRYLMLDPPFSPERYERAIAALIDDGCKALVVDSGSHAWEQDGGILESVEAFCQEKSERNRKSPDTYNPQAWAKFRPIHRHMIQFASRNATPTVWCFRAREKTKVERVNGRIEFIPQGWQPITSDLASFEVAASIMFQPPLESDNKPGTVMRCKVTEALKGVIQPGKRIGEKEAKAIADYAKGVWAQKPDRAPSGADKTSGHSDTQNGSPRSEGAAMRQQMGISDEDPIKAARRLWGMIAKTQTSVKIKDLVPQVMDLGGKVPDETYEKLTAHLTAKSSEIIEAERTA